MRVIKKDTMNGGIFRSISSLFNMQVSRFSKKISMIESYTELSGLEINLVMIRT